MLLKAHNHCIACVYLLKITFIHCYLSLIQFMVLRNLSPLTLVTVLPHFTTLICYYNVLLLQFSVIDVLRLFCWWLRKDECCEMRYSRCSQEITQLFSYLRQDFFSRIHVSLSFWCHNVHTLSLSHAFTTHGSEYAVSLGVDVPNIYRIHRIHFAKH